MERFPLAVRQQMETNKKWNPDDGLLFFEIVSNRKAKVCTFKQGASYVDREYNYSELISCKTFAEFTVWVFCERYDSDVDSVFQKIYKKTFSRVIRSSKIINTIELENFYNSYFRVGVRVLGF